MRLIRSLAFWLAALSTLASAQPATPKKHLLVLGEEKGYRHEAVSHAMATIERLGNETGLWDTTIRTDTEVLTKKKLEYNAKNLNDFDAVLFYTGGELPMDASGDGLEVDARGNRPPERAKLRRPRGQQLGETRGPDLVQVATRVQPHERGDLQDAPAVGVCGISGGQRRRHWRHGRLGRDRWATVERLAELPGRRAAARERDRRRYEGEQAPSAHARPRPPSGCADGVTASARIAPAASAPA